jgi:lysozyme family protein
MADINKSLPILFDLEYGNRPRAALEQVVGEDFLTYKGITERFHPMFAGWSKIHTTLAMTGGDMARAGELLETDATLARMVAEHYHNEFWGKARLDEVAEQHKADEIFTAMVLNGAANGIKFAQRVVGVADDGVFGDKTLAAVNAFDGAIFDKLYDEQEMARHEALAANNPKFKQYLSGWKNRDRMV